MYDQVLQQQLYRTLALLVIGAVVVMICLVLLWVSPLFLRKRYGKGVSKKRVEAARRHARQALVWQIVLTVCLTGGMVWLFASEIPVLQAMQTDLEQHTYSTYSGEYAVSPRYTGVKWGNMINDLRTVTVDGIEDPFWIEMSCFDEGLFPDVGKFEGTLVYAVHSRRIVARE